MTMRAKKKSSEEGKERTAEIGRGKRWRSLAIEETLLSMKGGLCPEGKWWPQGNAPSSVYQAVYDIRGEY